MGFKESKIIPCLFFTNVDGRLCGLATLHVDDVLLTGDPQVMKPVWDKLRSHLKFGSWTSLREGGKFLGRWLKQSEDLSEINMTVEL